MRLQEKKLAQTGDRMRGQGYKGRRVRAGNWSAGAQLEG